MVTPRGVQLVKDHHDLRPGVRVEIARRLVGQQELGLIDDGPGDGHPLALAAGELRRHVVGPVGQAHHLQRLQGQPVGADLAGVKQRHGHVRRRARPRQQVERLKDKPDRAVADLGQLPARRASLVSWPSKRYCPAVGRSRQPRMPIIVLLPEPEAPVMLTNSPGNDVHVHPGQGVARRWTPCGTSCAGPAVGSAGGAGGPGCRR